MTRIEYKTLELFQETRFRESLGQSAVILRAFALPYVDRLLPAVAAIEAAAPFRCMVTPGGFTMSVALTNCGEFGWISDLKGYRYSRLDPQSGRPWPEMPECFAQLSSAASETAGFGSRRFDACLVNRYVPGTKLTLHQDKNEKDFSAPIVSVSLGMTATFLFGGTNRANPTIRVPLVHGDVVVWGGEDRLRFHGIAQIKDCPHPVLGRVRINCTFRQAY